MTQLPVESSQTASHANYKEGVQNLLRDANFHAAEELRRRVIHEAESIKTDDLRKIVVDLNRDTDAAMERKTDPNANLPVFNIVFNTTTGSITEAPAPAPLDVVEEVEDAQTASPAPKPALAPYVPPDPVDVSGVLGDLDALLRGTALDPDVLAAR